MWLSHGVWGDGFPSPCELGVIYPTGRKNFSWVKIDRYVAISKNDLDKPYELENDDRLLDEPKLCCMTQLLSQTLLVFKHF